MIDQSGNLGGEVADFDSTRPTSETRELLRGACVLLLVAGAVTLGLLRLGLLTPRMVTDSSSYTEFPFTPASEALRAQRTIGYPLFLAAIDLIGDSQQHAAWGHWIVHILACGVFAWGLLAYWRSGIGCASVASTMLFANLIYRYVDNITPDVLTASVAIGVIGLVMRFAVQRSWTLTGLIGLGVFSCCMLRPAYLFMLPAIPLMALGLRWIHGEAIAKSIRAVAGLAAACFVPTILFCVVRYAIVGYVGLVSFGGNNLAGVMCAFLDEATVAELPAGDQEYGRRVLAARQAFADEHGEFPRGIVSSYSVIEDQFDDSTWRICVPVALELHDNDWPAANQAMMSLGFSIIRAHPDRFCVWLLKATRRAAQVTVSEFVGNPAYLLLLLLLAVARTIQFARRIRGEGERPLASDRTLASLIWVAVLFLIAKTALVILTSPPLGRFMDAAAIMLCTIPAYLLWPKNEG